MTIDERTHEFDVLRSDDDGRCYVVAIAAVVLSIAFCVEADDCRCVYADFRLLDSVGSEEPLDGCRSGVYLRV